MALETGTYIDDLNASNPASTDGLGQADDHMRLIKATVKNTFPNISNAVTSTHGELNIVDGSTSRVGITVVDGDGVVMNDGGTMKQVNASSLKTYMAIPDSILDLGISDGSNGQFLKTNGSGSFSFAVPTDTNDYVNSLSWNTGNGVLTVGRTGSLADLTVDLDGRYLTTHPTISAASSSNNSGTTFIQDVTVDSNGHVTGLTAVDANTALGLGGVAGRLVGYGSGAGLNGDGNFDMAANTSYLFYAPNGGSSNNIYIYQNNNLNDRLLNGIPNFAGLYVYANGSTARSDCGMGGVSGGNPGAHLIFELT